MLGHIRLPKSNRDEVPKSNRDEVDNMAST